MVRRKSPLLNVFASQNLADVSLPLHISRAKKAKAYMSKVGTGNPRLSDKLTARGNRSLQVIKMLVTVVLIFAFCWLPWQILQILMMVSSEVLRCVKGLRTVQRRLVVTFLVGQKSAVRKLERNLSKFPAVWSNFV